MSKEITKGFIQLQNAILECEHFCVIQSVIIAKIASWQRNGKTFFQSKQEIAKEFRVDRKTISRRMDSLEEMGVIQRDGKVKRSVIYKVNIHKLDMYLKGTHPERNVPDRYTSSKKCTTSDHYNNNNKNSNKTIFIEEGTSGVPSSTDQKALDAFLKELNDEL